MKAFAIFAETLRTLQLKISWLLQFSKTEPNKLN